MREQFKLALITVITIDVYITKTNASTTIVMESIYALYTHGCACISSYNVAHCFCYTKQCIQAGTSDRSKDADDDGWVETSDGEYGE